MIYSLVGPFDFDETAPVSSARAAFSTVCAALREKRGASLPVSNNKDDGLYLLVQRPDAESFDFTIAGFWLVFGARYLIEGPAGPPDRVPPFCRHVLDAATEELWWTHPVSPFKDGIWTPLVILEWPPRIANRSAFGPPGVPVVLDNSDDASDGEPESWLEPVPTQVTPKADLQKAEDNWVNPHLKGISDQRAIITVVRGRMQRHRHLHEGSFELLFPEIFGDGPELAVQEWLGLAVSASPVQPTLDDEGLAHHSHGRPLHSFYNSTAFPISGWITSKLQVWPHSPSDITRGTLNDREVQSQWIQQARLALSSSVAVLLFLIPFSFVIQWLAQPNPREALPVPPPAPQPAMAVCSADNHRFVEEFRCQIAYLESAHPDDLFDTPICGDRDSLEPISVDRDLQAEFCGILDRDDDGFTATITGRDSYSFAEIAAAQSCFNVLGYPYPYQLPRTTERLLADPKRFLADKMLGVRPLVDMMDELKNTCKTYGERLEHRLEGAILATHIGDPGDIDEASKLRKATQNIATLGLNTEGRRCFQTGLDQSVNAEQYLGLCTDSGDADEGDRKARTSKIWVALDGEREAKSTLIGRYVNARFGAEASVDDISSSLWQCHFNLSDDSTRSNETLLGPWDIPLPIPQSYGDRRHRARGQLVLDAMILSLRDSVNAGICWDSIGKMLARYEPVHPLLEELTDDSWPSSEQQLCGQICQVGFHVSKLPPTSQWVTPKTDLALCVDTREAQTIRKTGHGQIDRLALPWNYNSRGEWTQQDNTQAAVCAFNLIAQNRLPADDGLIVGDQNPAAWAGETASGSKIAGGENGLSVRAVSGMSRFGTRSSWSMNSCGYVGVQCFTGIMLQVLGDPRYEHYDWLRAWQREVQDLSHFREYELSNAHPWCAPLQPYLMSTRASAQFDAPCRAGVEEARIKVERSIQMLAGDIQSGGSQ